LNKFCRTCQFRNIPTFLKQRFNELGTRIFIDECPLFDDRVKGCTTKLYYNVDWKKFCELLLDNKIYNSEEEKKEIERFVSPGYGDSQGLPTIS